MAENVDEVYPTLLSEFPSLDAIRRSYTSTLADVIELLGFYNIRSDAFAEIAATYGSLPQEPGELSQIPRIGQYVANATLCFVLDRQFPVIDRNVDRVFRRIFGDARPIADSEQLEFAEAVLPLGEAPTFNLALLNFGATISCPGPSCSDCFANDNYVYYNETVAVDESPD